MKHKTGWDRRRHEIARATPKWANAARIREIYVFAKRHRLHVDHRVPLNSAIVCGLHCEDNLQVLPAHINLKKGNFTWTDKPFENIEMIEMDYAIQLSLFN